MIRCPQRLRRHEDAPSPPLGVVVETRRGNYSAFNGYHFTPSDYSRLRCLDCGWHWRSKAPTVSYLRDETDEERANPPWSRRRT